VVIKVHDGTLLMFASYLEHSVDAKRKLQPDVLFFHRA
jgi:hypothetical protein